MPWFRHPIEYRIRHPDPSGPIRMMLRARLPVQLERHPGEWVSVRRAVLDTGANLCVFSAVWAREVGFELPRRASALPTRTAGGAFTARVYDLDLTARFPQLPGVPFPLAVVFSESHPPAAPPLLGLHNLLDSWRYTFNGEPEPAATMGHMRFETA